MGTEKRYLHDSLFLNFKDTCQTVSSFEGKPSVILKGTAFYPQSGGQPGDWGELTCHDQTRKVVDTQIDEDGFIHHILDDPFTMDVSNREMEGTIQEDRRRDYMSQHTAQHMLSAAFYQIAEMETVSARMGSEAITIDLRAQNVTREQMDQVEDLVNNLVLQNRPIRPLYPTPAELEGFALRRPPKVTANIRILDIDGFDKTPCGGTHCSQTGQVGPVKILGSERSKDLIRVSALAGKRTLKFLNMRHGVLSDICSELGCGPEDLSDVFNKYKNELREQSQTLGKVRAELTDYLCAKALDAHPLGDARPLMMIREKDDLVTIRRIASKLVERPDVLVLAACCNPDGQWSVVLERGKDVNFHAGNWFREQSSKLGGRGGGRPERAEGRWPAVNWDEIQSLLQNARQ